MRRGSHKQKTAAEQKHEHEEAQGPTAASAVLADAGRLAVISCHYNFAGFESPRRNLHRFLAHMAASGVPVYGVEAHLGHEEPTTRGLPGWRQVAVPAAAVLWQKEALLNAAEKLVPPQYDQIAWIDADLTFSRPDWPQLIAGALLTARVVQPFENCRWLARDGTVEREKQTCLKHGLTRRWHGHPGFAWAARRDLWREGGAGGIYPYAVAGNGDTCWAAALLSEDPVARLAAVRGEQGEGMDQPATRGLYETWARGLKQWAGHRLAWTACDVLHHWHGDRRDRRYEERYAWLGQMDAGRELTLRPEGHLEWTQEADPVRVRTLAGYFVSRKED